MKPVWRNLIGAFIRLYRLCTPGLACNAQHTLSRRLIAIWRVIDEVKIAFVGVRFEGCGAFSMHRIVVCVYPSHAPNKLAPMLADYGLDVFAFCYHVSQVLQGNAIFRTSRGNILCAPLRMRRIGEWGISHQRGLSVSAS